MKNSTWTEIAEKNFQLSQDWTKENTQANCGINEFNRNYVHRTVYDFYVSQKQVPCQQSKYCN